MYQKNKIPYGGFGISLIVVLAVSYLFSGICNISNVTIFTFEESLIYAFTHPFEAWNEKTPAIMAIGFLLWMGLVVYYLDYHRNFHTDPHGSSGWRDVHEANQTYQDKNPKNNRILTQNLQVSLEKGLPNNNMLLVASSGDFKTTSVVEPNLLQMSSTYIMLDVKGETQRKLGNVFLEAGYNVRSLNFKQPDKSDRYNPFVYIEKEEDLLRTIKALHDACRPKTGMSSADPFWDDAVNLYLQSMFYAVWLSAREKGTVGTMNDLLKLVNMEAEKIKDEETGEELSKLQIYMDDLANSYGADYPPVRDYRKLKDGAPETVRSVILMVNVMLSICETAEVKRIFSGNDIQIRELGSGVGGDVSKKSILFLVLPDNNNVYNWIVSMFYTQAFDILIRHSDDELKKPLPIRVEFWMDEFYAGAKPADADVLLGVIRSRNLCMIPVLQSFSQLKALYKDDKWEIIMDNTSVVLFFGSGPTAEATHKYVSELLGKTTIDVMHDNKNFGQNSHSALNYNQQARELMTPDEVKRMPTTDAIVFLKASQPIYDKKAIPFDKPELGYSAPRWHKERYAKALKKGRYEHPVRTIYDPVHFRYITVEHEQPLKIITDKTEIETYQQAAKADKDIYTFHVNEDELLYLSWGYPEYTQENVEQIYKKIMEDEEKRKEAMRGLIVLQNSTTDSEGFTNGTKKIDKSGWNKYGTFQSLLKAHWDDLSLQEQEEICIGIDDGLTEEQLYKLMLRSLDEVTVLRMAYMLENRRRKANE